MIAANSAAASESMKKNVPWPRMARIARIAPTGAWLVLLAASASAAGDPPAGPPQSAPGKAGIEWVSLPGGTFTMGPGSGDETAAHLVAISAFEMAKTLVTNKQYRACIEAGACTAPNDKGARFDGDQQPVVGLDWNQAKAFTDWVGGSLPTEAQWEYAARSGGRRRKFPWGDEDADCERGVFSGCAAATLPVCSKPKGNTDQGLCDMSGNAYEWTLDNPHHPGKEAPREDGVFVPEKVPDSRFHVTRGSAWNEPPAGTNYRSQNDNLYRFYYYGLRPVRRETH
jgi:formylglycine-generating enzyme required for sulfatase activity